MSAQLLTSKEAAETLRVTTRTLLKWRKAGKAPPSHPVGRKLLYDADELREWIKSREHRLTIEALWDAEAGVWYSTGGDVPGLCIQANTFDELVDIATSLTPDLLRDNGITLSGPIALHITAERLALARDS